MEVKLLLGRPTLNLRIQWLRVRVAPGALSFMSTLPSDLKLIQMLSERLERISADSVWAHRASGVRGALLRILDETHKENPPNPKTIANTLTMALKILEQAAKRR